jgi:hypothetical protein
MTLHQYLSDYAQTLQTILETNQEEADIMQALEQAYPEDDARCKWIHSQLTSGGTKKGIDSDDEGKSGEKPTRNKPVRVTEVTVEKNQQKIDP